MEEKLIVECNKIDRDFIRLRAHVCMTAQLIKYLSMFSVTFIVMNVLNNCI